MAQVIRGGLVGPTGAQLTQQALGSLQAGMGDLSAFGEQLGERILEKRQAKTAAAETMLAEGYQGQLAAMASHAPGREMLDQAMRGYIRSPKKRAEYLEQMSQGFVSPDTLEALGGSAEFANILGYGQGGPPPPGGAPMTAEEMAQLFAQNPEAAQRWAAQMGPPAYQAGGGMISYRANGGEEEEQQLYVIRENGRTIVTPTPRAEQMEKAKPFEEVFQEQPNIWERGVTQFRKLGAGPSQAGATPGEGQRGPTGFRPPLPEAPTMGRIEPRSKTAPESARQLPSPLGKALNSS